MMGMRLEMGCCADDGWVYRIGRRSSCEHILKDVGDPVRAPGLRGSGMWLAISWYGASIKICDSSWLRRAITSYRRPGYRNM